MTNDIVICAEGLGKKYVIGHQAERERYVALRDVLASAARNAWRKTADMMVGHMVAGDSTEEFWALKDVSFEVKRGEVLGIIGRNGAGKSTLLKILSRITEPSEGRVTIEGRVASLLEVGTGFHPELTGRENIYLNGAILGMTRAEIRRKFDEIVAFAEVEKFLDTPVKRYSSGMYVRLAFAVAAHLEPEILVVDEVLAVGDAEFQKKCLGKMSEVAGQGRTVLFVSHNMAAVQALCVRGLVLENGLIVADAPVAAAIAAYSSRRQVADSFSRSVKPSSKPKITSVRIFDRVDEMDHTIPQNVGIEISITSSEPTSTSIDIRLKDQFMSPVAYGSLGAFDALRPALLLQGTNAIVLELQTAQLASGEYLVSIDLTHPFVEFFDRVEDCIRLQIEPRSDSVSRRFDQSWGYGSVVIPLTMRRTATATDDNSEAPRTSPVMAEGKCSPR